jgi:hypothetical protein
MNATGPYRLRAVTHYEISAADVERTLTIVEAVLRT